MRGARHNRVRANVYEGLVSGDEFGDGEGVEATCLKCGHIASARGTGESSRICALAKLRDSCPLGETNYYVDAMP